MKIDIHCHSTASDGSLSPEELVQRAHNLQVNVLALTDHDTLAGIVPAKQAAEGLQGGVPLSIVSGIELSCRWHSFEIHILGWHFDPEHPQLVNLVAQQTAARRERAAHILQRLDARGVKAEHLQGVWVQQQDPNKLVTRKHIADALLAGGYVKNLDEAFARYLGKGQSAYVQPAWCTIEQAVDAIQAAGGEAGIAHPLAYAMSSKWLKRLVTDFKLAGGHAIEVSSGQQAPQQRAQLAQLANDFELMASAGSDFHSPGRWRELGHNLKLPPQARPVWQHWSEVNGQSI